MSTLSKFELQQLVGHKQPQIQKALSFRYSKPIQQLSSLKKLASPIWEIDSTDWRHLKLSKITQAYVRIHALQRWNERVGPITSLDTLQATMDAIVKINPNRLELLNDEWAILDNEIVLVYEIENQTTLKIISFYGRISCTPALTDVKRMKTFCHYHGEKINLALTYEELQKQKMPVIPKEITYFSGNRTKYALEKYYVKDYPNPYYLCYCFDGLSKIESRFFIDTTKPNRQLIGRSVLRLLFLLQDYEFLTTYFLHFEPNRVTGFEHTQDMLIAQ